MTPGTNVYIRARVVCEDPLDSGRLVLQPLDQDRRPTDGTWIYVKPESLVKASDILKAVKK